MFKPLPPETQSSIDYLKRTARESTVILDFDALEYLEQNVSVVNNTIGTDYVSLDDMCRRAPNTAYGFIRSALRDAYIMNDGAEFDNFLPPREAIDIHGRQLTIDIELTDEDKQLLGEDMAHLVLYRLNVITDKHINS